MPVNISIQNQCIVGETNSAISIIITPYMETLPYSYNFSIREVVDGVLEDVVFDKTFVFETATTQIESIVLPNGNYATFDNGGFQIGAFLVNCTIQPPCDIAITSVSVVHDQNANSIGQITINATSGVGGLEYSINGATWQTSNIITGLPSGTYHVYARDSNQCFAYLDDIVVNSSPCDLVINSLVPTDESGIDLNDGSVAASASSSAGGILYNLNGGTYQASGTFTGLAPGSYTLGVLDAVGCSASQAFTILSVEPEPEPVPGYIEVPIVNPLRFVPASFPTGCGSFQNDDNTLFANQKHPGIKKGCYFQLVQKCDIVKIQWKSNYTTNLIRIANIHTGVTTDVVASPATLPVDYLLPVGYTIVEASINWNSFDVGKYSLMIVGEDPNKEDGFWYGEPVDLRTEHETVVTISYRNYDQFYGLEYLTGFQGLLRIPARFWQMVPSGKSTVMNDSMRRTINLGAYEYHKKKLEVFLIPQYLHRLLRLIFRHDYVLVNGEEYQAGDENMSIRIFNNWPLVNGEIDLTKVDFPAINNDDAGDIDVPIDNLFELGDGNLFELS